MFRSGISRRTRLSRPSNATAFQPLIGTPATLYADFADGVYYNGGLTSATALLTTTRATPTTAYAQTVSGSFTGFAANIPRITNQGLLVEEARTNNTFYSNAITSVGGNFSNDHLTLTTSQTSPEGLGTASLVTDDTTAGVTHRIISSDSTAFVSTTTYVISCYVQYGGANPAQFVQLTFPSAAFGASQYATFDILNAAVVGGATAGGTATATKFSNGWILLSFSAAATGSVSGQSFVIGGNPAQSNSRTPSYNGTSLTYFIWNPQCETGSFPTSPIVTTSNATVTRAADVVTVTTPPAFGSSWSLFGKANINVPSAFATPCTLLDANNTSSNRNILRKDASTTNYSFRGVGGTGFALTFNGYSQGVLAKIAGAAAAADQAFVVNNNTPQTSSAATLPTAPNAVNLGCNASSAEFLNGYLQSIAIWPSTRITNAQLQTITT